MSEELNQEEAIFTIITGAGEARAKVFEALALAEQGEIALAKERYQEAEGELHQAHRIQTRFIQQESSGQGVEINMLFVHAQDHLMTAISEKGLVGKMLGMHEQMAVMNARLAALEAK